MALLAKQLPFEQVPVSPHSTETYTYNPLGYIPILIDQSGLDPIRLTESIAILHYLERCHPAPREPVPFSAHR
jgi:glutathione S-transferase